MTRRRWWHPVAVAALGLPMLAIPTGADGATPATDLVIHGRGSGHGVGLPQDGALALGRAGKTAAQILDTFYPGTTLQTARSARMHVAVWQSSAATASTSVTLPDGGRVYGANGHLAIPAGGSLSLAFSGSTWTARLATIPVGGGGRSVPRLVSDDGPDPAPDDTASATPASPDPSVTQPDATATPTDSASTADPGPTASAPATDGAATPGPTTAAPTAGAPATSPAGATGSAPAGSGPAGSGPTAAASAGDVTAGAPAEESGRHPADPPGATQPADAAAADAVTGSLLDIVPAGVDGVTTVTASGRSYRGQVLTAPGELVNDVPLELYLRGLGEVLEPGWPQAGLRAFVIAARTYALRDALGAHDPGDHQHVNICATDACQVYLGADVEYPQLTAAVEATAGEVLDYQGALAETYYSASAGGETASPAEGFGADSTDVPYLTPVSYDDGGHDGWQRSIDLGAAATGLGYPGRLSEIEVTGRGPSGRVTTAVLHGSAGDLATTGLALEAALGLPSTLFTTGFGIDAPQVAAATSSSTLPPLTAASLGAVSVPIPVIAADIAADQPVPAASALTPAGSVVRRPSLAVASLDVRPGRWGLVVWLSLLALFGAVALAAGATRLVRAVLASGRRGADRGPEGHTWGSIRAGFTRMALER